VINADKLIFNGDREAKMYYRHSGLPGALKEISAKNVPLAEVLKRAVRGMLPSNKLQSVRLARLRVFSGSDHDHTAQTPETITIQTAKETK
jgi:large subunit ribosomal protein L13